MQRRTPEAEWTSERQLRRERSQEGSGQAKHIPDAEVLVEGRQMAIEVELHFKGRQATKRCWQAMSAGRTERSTSAPQAPPPAEEAGGVRPLPQAGGARAESPRRGAAGSAAGKTAREPRRSSGKDVGRRSRRSYKHVSYRPQSGKTERSRTELVICGYIA